MIAVIFSALVIFLYAYALLRPAMHVKKKSAAETPSVAEFISVIVPVRNEDKFISRCLDSLAAQQYKNFEVIVVDDHSEDRTAAIVNQIAQKDPRFHYLEAENQLKGKKAAVTAGVHAAKGKLIAVTDGDCVLPAGWLTKVNAAFADPKTVLASGMVAYEKQSGLLRQFLQAEQLSLQLVSAGAIRLENPLMCSAASLAYRKDFFLGENGYANDKYVSGDDMLLLLKAKKRERGIVALPPDCIVETQPAQNLREAVRQRARWVSKSKAYRGAGLWFYAVIVLLTNLLLPVTLAAAIIDKAFLPAFLVSLGGKMAVDLLLLSLSVPFFREPRLLLIVAPGQIFYPLLALVATVQGYLVPVKWKGRSWKM